MSSSEQDTKDAVQLAALNLEQQNQEEANKKEAANQDALQAAEAGAPQMNVQGDQKPEATDDAKKDGPKSSQQGQGEGGINENKNDIDIGAGGLNALYTLAEQHAEAITNEAWSKPMLGVLGKGNEPSADDLLGKLKDKVQDLFSGDQAQDQEKKEDKDQDESLGLDQFNTKDPESDGIELSDMSSNLDSVSDIVPK